MLLLSVLLARLCVSLSLSLLLLLALLWLIPVHLCVQGVCVCLTRRVYSVCRHICRWFDCGNDCIYMCVTVHDSIMADNPKCGVWRYECVRICLCIFLFVCIQFIYSTSLWKLFISVGNISDHVHRTWCVGSDFPFWNNYQLFTVILSFVSFQSIYRNIFSWNVWFSYVQVHLKRLGLHDANWTWTMPMSKLLFLSHLPSSFRKIYRYFHVFLRSSKINGIEIYFKYIKSVESDDTCHFDDFLFCLKNESQICV